jgi:hypothetical protein
MPDVFDRIQLYARTSCGDDPVCVHAENIQDCTVERHPDYSKFRETAIASGKRSSSGSRAPLWESMVALGRLCDMDGDDKWRMIILDCLAPVLRARSWKISRTFFTDRADVQSDMVEVALKEWEATARGVPARQVRGAMVKAAVSESYRRAKVNLPETSREDVEVLLPTDALAQVSAMKSASTISVPNAQGPDMAEMIQGILYGASLQGLNCIDRTELFHKKIRSGHGRKTSPQAGQEPVLSRSQIPRSNHYYRISEFLPASIGIKEAAAAMGKPESTARRMIRDGTFPCPVTIMGKNYSIPVKAFMLGMNITDSVVHPDDVEYGAAHAAGGIGELNLAETPEGLDCPDW